MEDAHTHLINLGDDKECCFFGVYDGHGGKKIILFDYVIDPIAILRQ